MKTIYFRRESNNFEDILNDPSVKKKIIHRIKWTDHLLLSYNEKNQELTTYIMLKFGDDVITDLIPDFSPKMFIDYQPDNLPSADVLAQRHAK